MTHRLPDDEEPFEHDSVQLEADESVSDPDQRYWSENPDILTFLSLFLLFLVCVFLISGYV